MTDHELALATARLEQVAASLRALRDTLTVAPELPEPEPRDYPAVRELQEVAARIAARWPLPAEQTQRPHLTLIPGGKTEPHHSRDDRST